MTINEFDSYLDELLAECEEAMEQDSEITIDGNGTNSFEAFTVIKAIKDRWNEVQGWDQ